LWFSWENFLKTNNKRGGSNMPKIDTHIYKMIRRMYAVEGMSIRGIARQLDINRRTVRKYCMGEVDPDKRKEYQIINSSYRDILEKNIIEIIEKNKNSPKKQSLNAKIIYQMLMKMGYGVGESTIRKYIRELRVKKPEVFIPLEFAPGEAMEFDWGDACAYIDKLKTKISLFCAVLPYSFGVFCAAFPDKTNSSFYAGNIMAFEYFGGVPLRCIYDNLRSAVLSDWGKNAIKQEKFKKLEAHYAFDGILCNKSKGNDYLQSRVISNLK
jgi:transposase